MSAEQVHDDDALEATANTFSFRALLGRLIRAPLAFGRLGLKATRWALRPRLLIPMSLLLAVVLVTAGAKVARQWPILAPVARAALSPGSKTSRLEALDPGFRAKIDRVLARLRRQGFAPRVRTTWRSPDRQELIYAGGRLSEQLRGTGPATRARGGMSCHNLIGDEGPAALAIDIAAGARRSGAGHARFYRALGEAAHAEGLGWGGDWKRSNRVWARYDLGWDPGHVQSRRCSLRKRRSARARYLRALESP